jgi:hypothetical protein
VSKASALQLWNPRRAQAMKGNNIELNKSDKEEPNGSVLSVDIMQDSLQDTLASHDSPPSPCEGVSPTININIDDTNDDTHKEEEEYAKV